MDVHVDTTPPLPVRTKKQHTTHPKTQHTLKHNTQAQKAEMRGCTRPFREAAVFQHDSLGPDRRNQTYMQVQGGPDSDRHVEAAAYWILQETPLLLHVCSGNWSASGLAAVPSSCTFRDSWICWAFEIALTLRLLLLLSLSLPLPPLLLSLVLLLLVVVVLLPLPPLRVLSLLLPWRGMAIDMAAFPSRWSTCDLYETEPDGCDAALAAAPP